jgi:putative PEP-CTERM system TPR-repeat lipoprotein
MRWLAVVGIAVVLATTGGCSDVDDAELLEKAQASMHEGDYRTASLQLRRALQANAGNAKARRVLGEVYLHLEEGASAEKELTRAIELGEPEGELEVALSEALLLQGKFDDVLRRTSINGAREPRRGDDNLRLRGEAWLGKGQPAKARESFEALMEADGNSSSAMRGLARCAMMEGDRELSSQWVSKAIEADSVDPDSWLLRGGLDFDEGKYAEAESAFSHALTESERKQLVRKQIAARLGRAQSLLAQQEFERAEEEIDWVLAKVSKLPAAHYLKAVVAYNKKEYEAAKLELYEVLKAVPDHAPSLLLMGSTSYATGNIEQANEYLTRYVALVPDNVQARKLLGAARLRLGNPGEAMEALKPAVDAGGEDAELLALVGQASAQTGQGELALQFLRKASVAKPDDPGIRSGLAATYIQQGQYDQAIDALERVVAAGDRRAQVMLVYAYLRKGDFDGARTSVQQVLESAPRAPAGPLLAGSVELGAGNAKAAEAQFKKSLELQADFGPAMVALGRLKLQEKDLDAAEDWFERARVQDEQNVDALIGLAQVSDARGNAKEAVAGVERARQASEDALSPRLLLGRYYLASGDTDKALEVLDEAKRARPGNPLVLSLLAQAQQRDGQSEQALATLMRLEEHQPGSIGVELRIADLQSRLGRQDQARNTLQKALSIDANAVQVTAALALVEARAGKLDRGLAIAKENQSRHPDSPLGYLVAGDIQMEQHDFAAADASYRQAFERSASRTILLKRVAALSRKGDDVAARTLITNWLAENPKDRGAKLALASQYQQSGDDPNATRQYRAVLEEDPDNVVALNNLAVLLGESDAERAIGYAERAVQLAPDSGAIKDTLGWLLVENGKHQEGRRYLQEAADAVDHPTIRYHLAVAMAETGSPEMAIRELRSALASQRTFGERAKAQDLLRRLQK